MVVNKINYRKVFVKAAWLGTGPRNVFVRAAHSPAALTNESGIYTIAKKIWLTHGHITLCWRRQAARLRRRPPRALLLPPSRRPSSLLRPHRRLSTLLPAAGARARVPRHPMVALGFWSVVPPAPPAAFLPLPRRPSSLLPGAGACARTGTRWF